MPILMHSKFSTGLCIKITDITVHMKVHHLSRIAGSVGGSHGFGPSVGFSFMIFLLMSMFIRMKHYSYNLDHNIMRPRVDRPVEIEG